MPKASFAKEDMYAPSGRGFVETVGSKRLGEVTNCVARYHQWQANKKTGKQTAPLTAIILSIAEIDAQGTHIAEPLEQELVVEWGPKDDSMIKIRPGLADSRTDDAVDTVDENGQLVLGTEGNCLYVEEGTKISMRQPFGNFVLSCQEKGFKPEILGAGFLPDFVGMRAWFDLKAGNKKDDGTAFNDFIVDSIVKFPYEKAAGGLTAVGTAKTAAAKAAKPAAKAAAAVSVATAPAAPVQAGTASASTEDIDEICIRILKQVSAEVSGEAVTELPHQKIVVRALQKVISPSSGIPKTQHKAIQETLKNVDWFLANGVSFGAVNSGDGMYTLLGE